METPLLAMSDLLSTFSQGHLQSDGYLLSTTLDPSRADLFHPFVTASTSESIRTDVRYATTYNSDLSLSKAESTAWLDLYIALWRAGREILVTERGDQAGLGNSQHNSRSRVYNAWKDVNNALYNGYTKGGFAAWTIPCLYMTSKWLRRFAIRADEQTKRTKENSAVDFSQGLNDDVVDDSSGQEKLEDAARQINRIFGLCLSDRYIHPPTGKETRGTEGLNRSPIGDTRKWGLYYITSLLFKTYFKVYQLTSLFCFPVFR